MAGKILLQKPEIATVEQAVERFLNSKRKENLRESTIQKLETIFQKQFLTWSKSSGLTHITEITNRQLEAFRDTWKDGPLARKKKQERIVGFFYYCVRLGWIKDNPARLLGRIKADEPPTDYFPKQEFDRIIDATYIYQPKGWTECRYQATRLRVLTWLMRSSGLAIRDAATRLLAPCETCRPVPNPTRDISSGRGTALDQVSILLGHNDGTPKRCHPHMLRDTFAVEMLLAGVPTRMSCFSVAANISDVEESTEAALPITDKSLR